MLAVFKGLFIKTVVADDNGVILRGVYEALIILNDNRIKFLFNGAKAEIFENNNHCRSLSAESMYFCINSNNKKFLKNCQ